MAAANKTIVTIATTLLAGTLLAACGSSGQIGDTGGQAANNKKLVLIPGVKAEPFYLSMQCGAMQEAKAKGYALDTQAPDQFAADQQTQIVTGVLAAKPAGVLIAPTDNKAMAGPMKQLTSAGIKVVQVDTALQDSSIAASSIASDSVEIGKKAADTLAKLAGGKPGSVLPLNTIAGTSTTDQRVQGFVAEMKKYPNLTVLDQQYTDNQPDQAASKVTGTLAAHPDLVGVFASNLNTGEGAGTGLKNANKVGQIQLVGVDASPKQVQALSEGVFQALIAQNPASIGKQGVDQVINALEGKPVDAKLTTESVAITKDDMSTNSQYFYKSDVSSCS